MDTGTWKDEGSAKKLWRTYQGSGATWTQTGTVTAEQKNCKYKTLKWRLTQKVSANTLPPAPISLHDSV